MSFQTEKYAPCSHGIGFGCHTPNDNSACA
ncbi:Uncharacterised protein [Vibrio cholerae]|nr:Uncharacterised protein [Vibrio cholerae]